MKPETRSQRRPDAKGRYSPFGAWVLVLILNLANMPRPVAKERDGAQA